MKSSNEFTRFLSMQRPSRRTFLRGALVSAGLLALPSISRANTTGGGRNTSLAFDGDSLLAAGMHLSRSDDGGASWAALPLTGAVLALATHPERPGRIVAGVEFNGIFVSEDAGMTWEERSSGLPKGATLAITIAAMEPDVIYAAIKDDGLWSSSDAGRTWEFVMDRPWVAEGERDLLALASVNLASGMGGIWIYAGTEMGLTRVPDCFCRWQDVQNGDAMEALVSGDAPPLEAPLPAGEPLNSLVSATSDPTGLYAAMPSGIWASKDAGVTWSRVSTSPALSIAVHPQNANQIVAAFDDGLSESRDGGVNWAALADLQRRN